MPAVTFDPARVGVENVFGLQAVDRRIAAHDPHTLSLPEYMRQIFWSSAIDLPDDLEKLLDDGVLLAGGPFLDVDGGMALVRAKDAEAAKAIFAVDPERESWTRMPSHFHSAAKSFGSRLSRLSVGANQPPFIISMLNHASSAPHAPIVWPR